MKKKAKKKSVREMTQEKRQELADALTRNLARMFRAHMIKTGHIVAEVQVVNNIAPQGEGKSAISQTVNIKFGVIVPREHVAPVQEGICLKSSV